MNKGRHSLKKEIKREVTQLFESALDYAQVACAQKDTFKVLRSRILRVGNDCIRNLESKIDRHYQITYVADSEDVIEVKNK